MRIASLDTLQADGGRRGSDFVKVTADDGLVGCSKYNQAFGGFGGVTALPYVRDRSDTAVASGECLFGRREYRPFLEEGAMDVAIIDVPWNGIAEAVKIAAMADACELDGAPHNFYSHLAMMMSAHVAAVVPNLRIMEIDPETVPWRSKPVTRTPRIEAGHLVPSTGPGWGPRWTRPRWRSRRSARARTGGTGGSARAAAP